MELWSRENQLQRKQQLMELHRKYCYSFYNDRGEYAAGREYDWRGQLYSSMPFLEGDEKYIARANAMLRFAADKGDGHFWSSAVAVILSRFHRETSSLAGPHSRAYMRGMCAHLELIHTPLYKVFGDLAYINPFTEILRSGEVAASPDVWPEIPWDALWHAIPEYHIPANAAKLALVKKYPFTVTGMAEQGSMPRNVWKFEDHPKTPTYEVQAAGTQVYTYMDENLAVGTSSRGFLDALQTTVFHLVYRKVPAACRQEEISTVFSRFIINEEEPVQGKHLGEYGKAFGVADKNTAMLLYHSRTSWGCNSYPYEKEIIKSLKLALLMTCFYGDPEEIWLGSSRLLGWEGESVEPASIYIKDGPVYMAFHPLIQTNYGREHAIVLRKVNGFGMVEFYNYSDSKDRIFPDIELFKCMNGFTSVVDSAAKWESFDRFREHQSRHQIIDRFDPEIRMRSVEFRNGDVSLAMTVSPVSEGIKFRSVNGRLVEEKKFEAEGFDSSVLPWT